MWVETRQYICLRQKYNLVGGLCLSQKSAVLHGEIACEHDLQDRQHQWERWGYREGERRGFYLRSYVFKL